MKRTNCDEHSEYFGSQTRRGHHNQPPDAVKDAADASARATRLVRTPHRTDGDHDGQIFWTGRASPPPNRDTQDVHRGTEAGQTGKFDADGDEL
jgi:hypothetical protein